MCLVLADDHTFLIRCKKEKRERESEREHARSAPGKSGSLKVPGPIRPISLNPLFTLVPQ